MPPSKGKRPWHQVGSMSRRRPKHSDTKVDPSDSNAATSLGSDDQVSANRIWRLPVLLALTLLIVAGSYFWFDYERPSFRIEPQQSSADVHRAILLANPENHDAHYNLGRALQTEGKLEDAISHYRRAIALSGGDASYHNNLGAALAAQGKLEEAIEQFDRAIEFDPSNAEARFNAGNALYSQDKVDEAIAQYRRAIELKADYAKAHNNLAVALKQSGHLEEAYQHRYEAMRLERAQQGEALPASK